MHSLRGAPGQTARTPVRSSTSAWVHLRSSARCTRGETLQRTRAPPAQRLRPRRAAGARLRTSPVRSRIAWLAACSAAACPLDRAPRWRLGDARLGELVRRTMPCMAPMRSSKPRCVPFWPLSERSVGGGAVTGARIFDMPISLARNGPCVPNLVDAMRDFSWGSVSPGRSAVRLAWSTMSVGAERRQVLWGLTARERTHPPCLVGYQPACGVLSSSVVA